MASPTDIPLAVQCGLLSQEDNDYLAQCKIDQDWDSYVAAAKPLCQDSDALFGHLLMGDIPQPHFWPLNDIFDGPDNIMLKVVRKGGKTRNKLFPPIIRRICYAIDGVSKYKDPRILAIVESGNRRIARMNAIMRKMDMNPLLKHAFADNDDGFEGMSDQWNTNVINIPKASGASDEDTLACITPNVASAGMQPYLFVADDVASPANSRTEGKAQAVVKFWQDVIEPLQNDSNRTFYYYTPYYKWDLAVSHLEPSGLYRIVEIPGLNRYPTRADYAYDTTEEGLKTNFRLTDRGIDLQSPWPCPLGDENACPGTKEHFDDVGYHRPVLALLRVFETNSRTFRTQIMLQMGGGDETSIKPAMLRFYCENRKDRRIGDPAKYWHSEDDFPGESIPPVKPFPKPEEVVYSVHGWDFGYGKKKNNDPSAVCRMYRTRDNDFFLKFHAMKAERHEIVDRIVGYANTDPVRKPDVIVVEDGGTQTHWKTDVDKALREKGVRHTFRLESAKRHQDKDQLFVHSFLPEAMGQGLVFVDIDDKEAVDELLSVTPDESSAHDDRFDAMVNAYPFARVVRPALRLGPKSGSAFLSR